MNAVVESATDGYVVLSGRMSREDVTTALATIAEYNEDEDAREGLGGLLDQECLIVSGGLLVRDTETGVAIEPGCCVGLEDWRQWHDLLDGERPWLGHDPDAGLEFRDGTARLWPDAHHSDGPACEIQIADLPRHLEQVRQDLAGFLKLVRKWAPDGLGEQLAACFDEHFHISAPL